MPVCKARHGVKQASEGQQATRATTVEAGENCEVVVVPVTSFPPISCLYTLVLTPGHSPGKEQCGMADIDYSSINIILRTYV